MTSRSPHLAPERLAFLQEGINCHRFYRDIAKAYTRRFKTPISKAAISGMVNRGELTAPADAEKIRTGRRMSAGKTQARYRTIAAMAADGKTVKEIAAAIPMSERQTQVVLSKLGIVAKRPTRDPLAHKVAARRPAKKHLPPGERPQAMQIEDDPISDAGISFMELRPLTCRFPVARDQKDKALRFCGERVVIQFINGQRRVSSWCEDHKAIVFRCEATLAPTQQAAE